MILGVLLLASACGSDNAADPSGVGGSTAGSAGTGAGATAGSAGHIASGGSAADAGAAGSAGSAGASGSAGSGAAAGYGGVGGGSAGNAGSGGTGNAGSGGVGAGGGSGASCNALPSTNADAKFPQTSGVQGSTQVETEGNRRIRAIAKSGSTVFVGGTFTQFGGVARNRLAAFDAQTGKVLPWDPGSNGEVLTIGVSPNGQFVHVGGQFQQVGGASRTNFAKLDAVTGAAVAGFNVAVNASVYQVAVTSKDVYLAGGFQSVAGQTRRRLARVDAASGAVHAWDPNLDDTARNVILSPDQSLAYVSGKFGSVGGQKRVHIAAIRTSDGTPTAWSPTWPDNPSAPQPIYDMALTPNGARLLLAVGGSGANGGNRLRAFDPVPGKNNEVWHQSGDGDHQGVAASNEYVFVGGHWDYVYPGGKKVTRKKFYVTRVSDGALVQWDGGLNSITGVHEVFVDCSALYVGGSFTTPRQGLAVFSLP